ncbi:UDP-glucose 4-epimerase GalE [Seleniivibrio woodruffii]|uniref:UDP-glucose 4-epimerase GalE n=1 Tax=Seleniivibrio woodruffii TaxID=1078050 RepID=UPI0026F1FFE0|nr:UDP-glucose 4-epimerase GalE [Seleniivibrio woodruffii]
MSTILIVGGAGYIGSHAVKELNRQGHDTIVLDSLVYGHRESVKSGKFVHGDMADTALLDRIFNENRIDAVMHFAAFAYVGESVTDPEKYYVNNVANTLNLLSAMRRHGCDKFIFSSTCATYGVPTEMPITEDHPQAPINPYGMTKLFVESILKDFSTAYGLKYMIFRYFNAAGADADGDIGEDHDPETHLIPLVLRAAKTGGSIKIFGTDYDTPDGTCVRDYIHVTDLAAAHILGLDRLMKGGENGIFNLGTGTGYSVREVISCAEKVTGCKISAAEEGRRAGDPPVLVADPKKVFNELGWRPSFVTLEDIIHTAWNWHRNR